MPLGGRLNQHWLIQRGDESLVLRRWAAPEGLDYETRLLAELAGKGWPVAPILGGPFWFEGHPWTLSPTLPGEPADGHGNAVEQRARGRLLAEFHLALAELPNLGQRPGWLRCEVIVADTTLDEILAANEPSSPEEIRHLRQHLEAARGQISNLQPDNWPGQIIHGDFTPWNLHVQGNHLTGILDFELSHWDHRIADFALSWRGQYDDVIHGYHEVSPLAEGEWQLLTPLWWAQLIEGACRNLRHNTWDDGWTIKKLLQRSPLMRHAAALPNF